MKAEEVQRRYAAGERNFSGADLRGQTFKGQTLSGANFSHADIRGANFTAANLSGANFTGAIAGVQKRWRVIRRAASLLLMIGVSIMWMKSAQMFVASLKQPTSWGSTSLMMVNLLGGSLLLLMMISTTANNSLFSASFSEQEPFWMESIRVVLISFSNTFLSIGGTTFYKADLTDANFTKATLKSTHLREANLTRVCWKEAQKLDRARVGNSILADAKVRSLLVTRNGYKQSFVDANFRGANLDGVNLNEANLTRADFYSASLRQADLRSANLTEVQAIETDFTGAAMTGACLEAWNIDHTTTLENIDCQFVFLLEKANEWGDRERRPHDPNKVFAPGDFKKLFREVMDTVQLLLRNGCNPDAFAAAFAKIMQEHPGVTPDSIQGFEKREDDLLVTIAVPKGTDKGQFEQDFEAVYQARLEAEVNAALLNAQKQHNQDIQAITQDIIRNFGKTASHINIMNQSNNPNISSGSGSFINTGDITGSTINLGQISGNVTNAINQLPSSAQGDRLKDLLIELQAAIESDPQLPTDDKQTALEQVKELAAAGQEPDTEKKRSIGKRATQMLKGIAASLPDAASLVEACAKLLPLITPLIGL